MFEEQGAPEIKQDIDCRKCKFHVTAFVLLKKKEIAIAHICNKTTSLIKIADVKSGACELYVCNDDNAQ